VFRECGAGNSNEPSEPVKRHLRRGLIVAESEGEGEQFSLARRERGPWVPPLCRDSPDGPNPVPPTEPGQQTAKSAQHAFRYEERDSGASQIFPDDAERDNPAFRPQSLLNGRRDLPFDPGDVFATFSIRGHQLKAGEPIPPPEPAGFPADHLEIFKRPTPAYPDDQREHLRTHGERLKNVDGLVVAEEQLGQDPDLFQESGRDDQVEVFRGIHLVDR